VVLAALAGAGLGARWYLRHSSRFNITRVALTPTDHASQVDLRRVAERSRGHNIFTRTWPAWRPPSSRCAG